MHETRSITPTGRLQPIPHRVGLFALLLLVAVPGAPALAAWHEPKEAPAPVWGRTLPFGADWVIQRGAELPQPFGVSTLVVTMSRDIEVTDVRITLPGGEPQSVSDVLSFDVRNHTTLAAVKLDAWILPVLDVYVMAGQTWTESGVDASLTLQPVAGAPVVVDVTHDTNVGGPLFGAGATLVGGYGSWFGMVDANFTHSDIEVLDGIDAWFVSARAGRLGKTRRGPWRAWLGAAWLKTERTLTLHQASPSLGSVVIEVDQRPVHPSTLQLGGSVGIGKHWELMTEVGSNFDDAFVGILSVSFRF